MGGCNYDDGFVLEILLLRDIEHFQLLLFVRCTVHDRIVLCKASGERQLWALTCFKLAVCMYHVMSHSFIAAVVPGCKTVRLIRGFSCHKNHSCIMLSEEHCISFCFPGWKLTWSFVKCIWNSYRGADKSLARPGRKQATATEDFDVHISCL
jgi:hypothetical protein